MKNYIEAKCVSINGQEYLAIEKISPTILALINSGLSLKEAIDQVWETGTFESLIKEWRKPIDFSLETTL